MYRWSKIPEDCRPEIISEISDDRVLTLIVQNFYFEKVSRKDITTCTVSPRHAAEGISKQNRCRAYVAWEGVYYESYIFKNIIDNNIPCTMMYKVKNKWATEIDTVVVFMTGECNDIFLVHPKDLTEWDSNEEIDYA